MPDPTLSISDFLLARIAEDELTALSGGCTCTKDQPTRPDCAGRISADADAKRQIVEMATRRQRNRLLSTYSLGVSDAYGPVLRALAFVYGDHPDYLDEWCV